MVRTKIPHAADTFYHLTLRGNRRQPVFLSCGDHELLERLIHDAVARHDVQVHAYCWMPNHLHLIARVAEIPLCRFVQHFAARYALQFNQLHETTGHLFQGRYWAGVIDCDSYLQSTMRYIHRNPVTAGLVESPLQFPWSSHAAYAGKAPRPAWLTTSSLLGLFADNRDAAIRDYVAFIDNAPTEPPDAFAQLLEEAQERFGLSPSEVQYSRLSRGALARAWIAHHAIRELGLHLLDVGIRLGKSADALRRGIDTHRHEIENQPRIARETTNVTIT